MGSLLYSKIKMVIGGVFMDRTASLCLIVGAKIRMTLLLG
jgi:hypothetical protein